MAFSRITKIGDGATNQFAVNFTLGYLSRDDITCRVGSEIDGQGEPIYRAITFLSDEILLIDGAFPAIGERVVFERNTPKEFRVVDFANGDVMDEENLDRSALQTIMLVHEVLDGRFAELGADVEFGGNRVLNVGDPIQPTDAANMRYVDARLTSNAALVAQATNLMGQTRAYRDQAQALGAMMQETNEPWGLDMMTAYLLAYDGQPLPTPPATDTNFFSQYSGELE